MQFSPVLMDFSRILCPCRGRGKMAAIMVAFLAHGCAELFQAHPNTVARVDDHHLAVQRLGQLMVLGQPLPLEEEVALELAQHWVDVSAFSLRLASGDSLWSEAFVRDALWLNIRRLAITRWGDRVAETDFTMSPTSVDSAYRAGEHRVVAHVLRAVPPDATPERRQQQRETAQRIRDQLVAGMSWEDANLQNEDSLTRNVNGSLGVTARGTFVPRFENVAYELAPGDLSQVVETQAGYHVIFRPRLENVREPFSEFVRRTLRARFDSTYQESIVEDYEVSVSERAGGTLREVAENPYRVPRGNRTVATYRGGSLSGERFARYVQLLPVQTHSEMLNAPDEDLVEFVRSLALEEILWLKADSAGLQPGDSTIALLTQNYRRDVARLWQQMGLSPDSVTTTADGQTPAERAATLVDRYFEAAVSRRIAVQPLPGFLTAKLRENVSWEIVPAGVTAAVELARRLQAGAGKPVTDGGPQ
jgi:hypothetical protein